MVFVRGDTPGKGSLESNVYTRFHLTKHACGVNAGIVESLVLLTKRQQATCPSKYMQHPSTYVTSVNMYTTYVEILHPIAPHCQCVKIHAKSINI